MISRRNSRTQLFQENPHKHLTIISRSAWTYVYSKIVHSRSGMLTNGHTHRDPTTVTLVVHAHPGLITSPKVLNLGWGTCVKRCMCDIPHWSSCSYNGSATPLKFYIRASLWLLMHPWKTDKNWSSTCFYHLFWFLPIKYSFWGKKIYHTLHMENMEETSIRLHGYLSSFSVASHHYNSKVYTELISERLTMSIMENLAFYKFLQE